MSAVTIHIHVGNANAAKRKVSKGVPAAPARMAAGIARDIKRGRVKP